MNLKKLNPRQALNKAFLKVKPNRNEIEKFKFQLTGLLDQIDESESEEFHKNLVSDFLKKTYYDPNHFINTKGRNDLVIHNGKNSKTSVGIIIEAKKPGNKAEMLKQDNINVKAFQELLLYYLRERIIEKNIEIKYLIAANIYEWFIFDAAFFEKTFVQNKDLVKQFKDFESGRLAGKTTDFFYKEIAEPAIAGINTEIEFTFFDIREYGQILHDKDRKDDNKLIALFKVFSPEHLLKLPFINDSNSLDKGFYSELLHIIGLIETREKGKKLIERKQEGERNNGSLLENAIIQIDSLDKVNRLEKSSSFGTSYQEKLFNIGLELTITWINRILFLKLLEAQLISYHKGDKSFSFLNIEKIQNFDDLNSLFFQVLARKTEDRNEEVKQIFSKVPYLNSSLFEPSELEHNTIFISNLKKEINLPVLVSTVLKDDRGKKRTGEIKTLEYLFEFLNAYDFAGEGSEEIQEENKSLINASVLGLIFEKINGYKDGSFFTPGFITMYMCRETVRRAVVQKFNDQKNWKCRDIDDLYDKIEDNTEANEIINSLKICDPAVGSGHFLVSALNEMIAIKSDLKILSDRTGRRLKEYQVEVVNDELIVTDEDGDFFKYNPGNKESQRIQETLFYEKQAIIENCLFGVDINPNSVKICRLRLWIELLKNAYYKADKELETLPNIDINIKCGNSLISRFDLDADLKKALKKSKLKIDTYKNAVQTYRQAKSKEEKQSMEKLIYEIKNDFRTEIGANDPKTKRLKKLDGDLNILINQRLLFKESAKDKKLREDKRKKLEQEISKLNAEIEEIKNNKIYENAFEWRFEFPEVLNDKGDFVGFDVVIGNPPYIQLSKSNDITSEYKNYLLNRYKTSGGRLNTFIFFTHIAKELLKKDGFVSFIIPNTILTQEYYKYTRKYLVDDVTLIEIVGFPILPFEDAVVETVIVHFQNSLKDNYKINFGELSADSFTVLNHKKVSAIRQNLTYSFSFTNDSIIKKVFQFDNVLFSEICNINQGIALKGDKLLSLKDKNSTGHYYQLLDGRNINKYLINWDGVYLDYDLKRIHSCKRKDIFETTEKLFFRRVSSFLIFTYDDSQFFALNTLVVVNLKENENRYDLKFILALMNSKIMNYVYRNKFKSTKKVFSEIQARSVEQLPIPQINKKEQNKFIKLAKKAIFIKKNNFTADISDIEKEIDQLVYKLYGLTKEEIAIVEQGT
ncbi:SAM-dependent methyltransferase [Desulfonema limicola]|uniref:site-specific DNA-methyltransferase (adenine-specific) n=1 Tax=Desulfonema limicola TaxID=45656 RepID=A0A975B9X6_9BACT|nr:TaqI-like C-terminal specificity domain-containing protein [Desulfonema limicola]QTA81441.1 SAM-dependent methyltransferase [Desulfonema limicola]